MGRSEVLYWLMKRSTGNRGISYETFLLTFSAFAARYALKLHYLISHFKSFVSIAFYANSAEVENNLDCKLDCCSPLRLLIL